MTNSSRRTRLSSCSCRRRIQLVSTFSLAFFFLLSGSALAQQLTISAITPSPATSTSTPNTFIGTVGNQIAASLLATNTPAMLWGAVSSSDINAACHNIVDTGSLTLTASVSNDWGGSEDLTLQVQATGGCLAASDASGTEFVFTDNYGRKSAVVCPSNAGSTGCGVYVTGDDVSSIYNSYNGGGGSKRKLLATSALRTRRMLADDCKSGAAEGAITGAASGILGTAECLALGPLAPFCVIGVLGVSAELGAAGGCIASCFPGDATVQTRRGTAKHMSQLELGDQIAVWGKDQRVAYQDVYAFGHKDANATATFLEISVEPLIKAPASSTAAATLRLTRMHFVPTAPAAAAPFERGDGAHVVYKRAQDIEVGDIVWAKHQQLVLPCIVKDISLTRSQGLFNPLTLTGTIIVDGVVASAHSEWFLDSIFDAVGLTHSLPFAYQTLLAPVRMLYHIMGPQAYISAYQWLDAHLDVATFGTNYGAHVTILAALICATSVPLLMALLKIDTRRKTSVDSM